MKEPTEYLQLASHFEAAAAANRDEPEHASLRDLARVYFALATTASVLQTSRKGRGLTKSGRLTM
jgi:hypothetical protein